MKIVFKRIVNGSIFDESFKNFVKNNKIEFSSSKKVAVVYGPNGTGKTSFIKTLDSSTENSELTIEYEIDGVKYENISNNFHIIKDQNGRNIIRGETKDFILGDNIKREHQLLACLFTERENIFKLIKKMLKDDYGIAKKDTIFIKYFCTETMKKFINSCANKNFKSEQIDFNLFAEIIEKNSKLPTDIISEEKNDFVIKDYSQNDSLILKLLELENHSSIIAIKEISRLEETEEAVRILETYVKDECIVCDSSINREQLLSKKKKEKEKMLSSLDEKIRAIVQLLINKKLDNDPFFIEKTLFSALETGNFLCVLKLIEEIKAYLQAFANSINNNALNIILSSQILIYYKEYSEIMGRKLDIDDEDYNLIQSIVENSMHKKLIVKRDEKNQSIRIFLDERDFLETNRDELPLSAGEQNFLSLTFELLKAKNSNAKIVVIDDPISSFDSIYKNKIAFILLHILKNKNQIIFTHNLDLVRLFNSQYRGGFNFYLLNNVQNEENGFILVNSKEEDLMINLASLLKFFREKAIDNIKNIRLFLISMIPFMRGYSNIIGNKEIYDDLCKVMHGYETENVNLGCIYNRLFGCKLNIDSLLSEVCSSDIINLIDSNEEIIDNYPLLNRTLKHILKYLALRLYVEKNLVNKYLDIEEIRKKEIQLGDIISLVFNGSDKKTMQNKVFFNSKKTLINEFNHFEGNLSIFQPAIDITDFSLKVESEQIIQKINSLCNC